MEHDGSVKHICCTDGEVSAREAAGYVLLCLSVCGAKFTYQCGFGPWAWLSWLNMFNVLQSIFLAGSCHHLKCTQHVHESAVITLECPIVSHLAFTPAHFFCIFIFSVNKSSAFWWWTQHVWNVWNEWKMKNKTWLTSLTFSVFFDKL